MVNLLKNNRLQSKLFVLLVVALLVPEPADSQGIFRRKKRKAQPIDPTSITPTVVTPPLTPEMPPSTEAPSIPTLVEEGEPVEEGAEGEAVDEDGELKAMPVIPPDPSEQYKNQAETALNREREAAANVSTPGVAALLKEAGQIRRLETLGDTSADASSRVSPRQKSTLNDEGGEDSSGTARPVDPLDDKLVSHFMTQPDARTFTFSIPAPRGQILDRKGHPLAQTKVVNYAAIEFPQWGDNPDETRVQQYAAERIVHVNELLGTAWDLSPKVVREHYLNRRWMPLLFSGALTKSESDLLRQKRVPGLTFHPVYLRHYPNEELLSHVIGFVGKRPPAATGPITNDEPIWGPGLGVQGLELAFNKQLTGIPGKVSQLYDGKGVKIRDETIRVPRPGHNVVTTIDLEMQRLSERLLKEMTHRGAMVVMNVNNGDVMAMASYPQFNPNDFIPSISTEKYKSLVEDPEKPLFPRAYKASYPPASTFKVCAALAFLDSGFIYSGDFFPCPSSWRVGNRTMSNWNGSDEGHMNVVSAIARSCNTWFYEVAVSAGADTMSSMALRLGLGERTGLPLPEDAGFIPTNRVWLERYGHLMSDGDEANMAIGQGRTKTTPLQIARMISAIANGEQVFNPRLVRQVQDVNHNVVEVFPVEVRNSLSVKNSALRAVRRGMYDVVNAPHGTGKAAAHPVTVTGKTGTGQWIVQENRNVAWFSGYFPAINPVYAFTVIYEGEPGEKVSGGRKGAPIIKAFLDEYLHENNLNEVLRESSELRGDFDDSYTNRTWDDQLDDYTSTSGSIFRGSAGNVSNTPLFGDPEEEPAAQPVRRDSIFNRLFKGRQRRR